MRGWEEATLRKTLSAMGDRPVLVSWTMREWVLAQGGGHTDVAEADKEDIDAAWRVGCHSPCDLSLACSYQAFVVQIL